MKWLKILGFGCLFIFILSFTLTSSNDMNQDLGRHLKIAELILKTHQLADTNFFSYTNSDFPFINHHWLSEIIFYIFANIFGLGSLVILKSLMIILAVLIGVFTALKKKCLHSVFISALIFSPLLLERSDIRPEIFGYVFFSVMLYILFSYKEKKKLLYIVPVIMALWINIHITFVFGTLLLVLISLEIIVTNKKDLFSKKYYHDYLILAISFAALLINPHFIKGALYPFFIFGNYGYTIVENQNLFFLSEVTSNPFIKYFFYTSPLIVGAIWTLSTFRRNVEAIILTIFSLLAVYQIRHFPFFVLAAIPIVGYAIHLLGTKVKLTDPVKNGLILSFFGVSIFVSLFFFDGTFFKVFDQNRKPGTLIEESAKEATDFVIKNKLSDNIFNNFDIGGYAIYRLYPTYKVFVDNRPEAYPKDFLQNTYIKLQENESLRNQVFSKYNIHTIFFAHTDQTPWGQTFLSSIVNDKKWKIIYLDSSIIILSNNTTLPDIRSNANYLSELISAQDNYLSLLYLSKVFSYLQQPDLATAALNKAATLNPGSCTIQRIGGFTPWYC